MSKDFIAASPRQVAQYLKLDQPEKYSGHSFRCTSATFLVNNGGTEIDLTRLGGWKSTSVAMGYIRKSRTNQQKLCNLVTQSVNVNKFVSAKALLSSSKNTNNNFKTPNIFVAENTNNSPGPPNISIDKNTNDSPGLAKIVIDNVDDENIDCQNWSDSDFDLSSLSNGTSNSSVDFQDKSPLANLKNTLDRKNVNLHFNNCQVTLNIN